MMSTSGKLTLAALTDTTASPGPARGEGSSSTTRVSGGPYCLQRTAFTDIECHNEPAHYRGRRRSEEHTSELQSHHDLVCRLLLEKKKKKKKHIQTLKKKQ